jgi:putative transposase
VADFTHVATLAGTVYVAFVVDVFSRAVAGWAAARHKRARLVLDALDMALWHRDHGGHPVSAGLIHHSDYAEDGVKPRNHGLAWSAVAC